MNQKKDSPPAVGEKILKFFLPSDDSISIAGDYEELFLEILQTKGKVRAHLWYWIQILKSIWGGISVQFNWSLAMFKNYIKVAIRNLKRHKIYAVINITGLALGLACCVLILLWINHETSYDRFHTQADNLYRVVNDLDFGPNQIRTAGSAFPLGPAMKAEIPEILEFSRFWRAGKMLVTHREKRFYEEGFYFTDPACLKMFSFPLIKGDPETALASPSSLVITQDMALKYFGHEDPLGKTIQTHGQHNYVVSGVAENIPLNSHLQFDFLGSMERAVAMGARTHWTGWLYRTYAFLQPGTDLKQLNTKLAAWIKTKDSDSGQSTYFLQPLTEVHLYGLEGEGAIRSLIFFSSLAALVLIIACINYMNLATAAAGSRAKEIGLRKVVGASRNNITKQFLSESVITALLALFISFLLVWLFLPVFSQLSGKQLNMNPTQNLFVLLGISAITLLTGLLAGSYPAWFLSRYRPARTLKGPLLHRKTDKHSPTLRKILVASQFVLTIVLIIFTAMVNKQMNHIRSKNLGFDQNHLIYMQIRGGGDLWERFDAESLWQKYTALKYELSQDPAILDIAAATCLPFGRLGSEHGYLDWDGKSPEDEITMQHMAIDTSFIKTFKLELSQGRNFSEASPSDTNNFILNETALSATGLADPIGGRFRLLDKSGEIIGIVKDFNFARLHHKIDPLVLHLMPYQYWQYLQYVFIRVDSNNLPQTLASIEEKWDRIIPEYPFEFNFLDETIDNLYKSEQRLGTILQVFTFLAIFISCFGLFGLISFAAEQRTKEIGIRKVLGASLTSIVKLLSKELLGLVVLANVVAWPAAYYFVNKWLHNFASRTGIGIGIFIYSGALALAIAMLTISFQSLKAAAADPVDSLRYE